MNGNLDGSYKPYGLDFRKKFGAKVALVLFGAIITIVLSKVNLGKLND